MVELLLLYLLLYRGAESTEGKILFVFLGLVVLYSALWTAFDLRGLKKLKGFTQPAVLPWFVFVALCWTLSFPCYLVLRAEASSLPSLYRATPEPRGILDVRGLLEPRWKLSAAVKVLIVLVFSVIAIVLILGAVATIVLLMGQLELPKDLQPSDRMELLFGASAVALVAISIVTAFLAIFGWKGLLEHIDQRIDENIEKRAGKLTSEVKGRINSIAGIIFYKLSLVGLGNSHEDRQRATSKAESFDEIVYHELLESAIYYTRKAIEHYDEVDHPAEWHAKNNLAYFLACRGNPADGEWACELSDEILKRHRDKPELVYVLTSVWVLIRYCRSLEDLKRASELLDQVEQDKERSAEASSFVNLYKTALWKVGFLEAEPSAAVAIKTEGKVLQPIKAKVEKWKEVEKRSSPPPAERKRRGLKEWLRSRLWL